MPLIRNISDTALLAAVYRAREAERPQPLFLDPFARRLSGDRGEQIAQSLKYSEKNSWAWIARTYLFDQFILRKIESGCDLIVNLAAGLDARPYRMQLPPSLRWVEIDLPEIIDYKEEILRNEKPSCLLERTRVDLSDLQARRELFAHLVLHSENALVVTEGIIIYLDSNEVGSLATDLARHEALRNWVLDLSSPALLRMLQKTIGKPLEQAAAPLKFAPEEGPEFFRAFGWKPVEVQSLFHTAGRLKRLPLLVSLFYQLQKHSEGYTAKRPWGGICFMEQAATN